MFVNTSGTDDIDSSLNEDQQARALLRERFLKVLTYKGIMNSKSEFHMFDNTRVLAEFCGCDVDVQTFAVQNLKTSLGNVPNALLRAEDIIRIHIPKIIKLEDLIEKEQNYE